MHTSLTGSRHPNNKRFSLLSNNSKSQRFFYMHITEGKESEGWNTVPHIKVCIFVCIFMCAQFVWCWKWEYKFLAFLLAFVVLFSGRFPCMHLTCDKYVNVPTFHGPKLSCFEWKGEKLRNGCFRGTLNALWIFSSGSIVLVSFVHLKYATWNLQIYSRSLRIYLVFNNLRPS